MDNIYSRDHIKLVKKIIQARNESGLSQRKAAGLLGKTQSYISKIETGQRQIDVVQLKSFAKIYKKKIKYFIND